MASADTIQQLEDLLERIGALQASLKKLTTESVSRPALKKESHAIHKTWLPIFGVLEDDANFSGGRLRSEEHTSELQSLRHLVCRLLLEKKKKKKNYCNIYDINRST